MPVDGCSTSKSVTDTTILASSPLTGQSATIDAAPELRALRSSAAVRRRCGLVARHVADGHSAHFTLDESRLDTVAAFVASVTREAYPDLVIPYHSRWRHFSADGVDRWSGLRQELRKLSRQDIGRAAIDLATVSVLLDAGAGAAWRYREPATGAVLARSEGLAVASLDMFRAGAFSSDRNAPYRVDSAALERLDAAALARGFQVRPDNPLVGLDQRVALLNRLGRALAQRADLFGVTPARPGNLVDRLLRDDPRAVSAPDLLATLLDGLSSIWPAGFMRDGVALGDAGLHPAVRTTDRSDGIVPFHKLTQWLTYSLIEPIEEAGFVVADLDGLTALPEYRNGGLLIDLGVIRPRRPLDPAIRHDVGSELVVEWRALTVTLMDRLRDPVRQHLGLTDKPFPLATMLQGGTWSAGRRIAGTLRPPAGDPPIAIAADGTVF